MIREDKDFLIMPFNDNYMTYNIKEHRYVLTYDGASKSNIELKEVMYSTEFVNSYLDLLSRTVYAIFSKNKDSKYYDKQLWHLSHSRKNREAIKTIFMDLMWYNYTSGGFMTLYQSGINLNEMKQLNLTIEEGLSVISNQMANMFGINQRVLKNDITRIFEYDTFEQLKDKLLELDLYTLDELNEFKSIKDISNKGKYTFGYNELEFKYYIIDNGYWREQLELKGTDW